MKKKQKKILWRVVVSAFLFILSLVLPGPDWIAGGVALLTYGLVGYDILYKAFKGMTRGRILDENFLMAVATLGVLGLAVYEKSYDFGEAVTVMLLYQIGELFQSYAVGKSRRNIASLMNIRPDYANVEENGTLIKVDPEQVEVGTVITVQPGEKVPLDGIVLSGHSHVDTVALTGESRPRTVKEGQEILSGCINLTGVLQIRTTKAFGQSTVSGILRLVQESGSRKSKSEVFISRFAAIYTPIVCACALALAVLPPVGRMLFGQSGQWNIWLYRALTFLVISCPCALVISIPLSFFAGLGGAGKQGILIKGASFLEALAKTRTVVFDKTGTLTEGVFEVSGVHPRGMERDKFLELAALCECASSHPIGRSILRAYGHTPDRSRVKNVEEISGLGVAAEVDGIPVACGNEKLMCRLHISVAFCQSAGTVLHLAANRKYAGYLVISDREKPTAKAAVDALRKAGIQKTVMLTGDGENTAKVVANNLRIDEYYAALLPEDKVKRLESLLAEKPKNSLLAFVGDGINDAPVLARADVGVAMGAMGSDAAIEAADVVLMDDRPEKLSTAVTISRKCMTIVYENIIFSLGVKLLCLLLGALGVTNMWIAIFADVGVMILAVLNAMRVLSLREKAG